MGAPILKPNVIVDYKRIIGAVDKTDMILNSINIIKKTLKWYKKFFSTCLSFRFTILTYSTKLRPEKYNICEVSFMPYSRNSTKISK